MYSKNILMLITIILFGISNVCAQTTEYEGKMFYTGGETALKTSFSLNGKEGSLVGSYIYGEKKGKIEMLSSNMDELIVKWSEPFQQPKYWGLIQFKTNNNWESITGKWTSVKGSYDTMSWSETSKIVLTSKETNQSGKPSIIKSYLDNIENAKLSKYAQDSQIKGWKGYKFGMNLKQIGEVFRKTDGHECTCALKDFTLCESGEQQVMYVTCKDNKGRSYQLHSAGGWQDPFERIDWIEVSYGKFNNDVFTKLHNALSKKYSLKSGYNTNHSHDFNRGTIDILENTYADGTVKLRVFRDREYNFIQLLIIYEHISLLKKDTTDEDV